MASTWMICCRKKRSRSLSHLLMSSCTQEDTTNYKQLISQACNFNVVHHRSKQSEPGESTSTRWHFAFGLCCHSNETCAPIANPPKEDNPYHSSKLHPGPYSSVGMWRGTDIQTDRHKLQWQTHRRAWPIYNSRHLRLTRNVARHRASRPYTSTCLHFTLGQYAFAYA